jgi:hypothetical protein
LAVPDERDLSALNATRASDADQALVNSVNMPI